MYPIDDLRYFSFNVSWHLTPYSRRKQHGRQEKNEPSQNESLGEHCKTVCIDTLHKHVLLYTGQNNWSTLYWIFLWVSWINLQGTECWWVNKQAFQYQSSDAGCRVQWSRKIMLPLLLATVKRFISCLFKPAGMGAVNMSGNIPVILRPGARHPAPYQWAPRGSISAHHRMGLIYRDCQGRFLYLPQPDLRQVDGPFTNLSPHQP